jgi:hypothetical protein
MNFLLFLSALVATVAALGTNTNVADVVKSIEDATHRQESVLKSTTQKLRALQERVNNLVAQ